MSYKVFCLSGVTRAKFFHSKKGSASVERNALSSVSPQTPRVQGFTSLHTQGEKKNTVSVDVLCVLLPNQTKVPRYIYI